MRAAKQVPLGYTLGVCTAEGAPAGGGWGVPPAGGTPPYLAASAATYPLRCFAPQWARFDNRHSTSVPAPTLAVVSGSGARGTSDPLNRQCYPPHFMRECIPPNLHDPQRAKGPLDRRSKRLSFPHFFLRRKKCGRRRPPPRQGETDSPPGQRPPRRRKKRDGLRRLFLYLISCPCGSATQAPAPARISASCSPPPACRSGCPARSTSRTQTWPR